MLAANERALRISLVLTGIYFVVEVILGMASGSLAVISDAFHTFSAVGGVLLALVAGRIASRSADPMRTFGSVRAEILGALLNGLFLLLMALVVIGMGVRRLLSPVELDTGLMVVAAIGGLFTEVISLWVLSSGQKGNLNMRGAYWHVMQTFVGSLLIIVAAVVVRVTGFDRIDPILGTVFGVVLVWAAIGISRDAIRILMETVPRGVNVIDLSESLEGLDGVESVHHLHAWALTTGRNLISAHVKVSAEADRDALLRRAQALVQERGFEFSTLQLEATCDLEEGATDLDWRHRP